MTHKFIEPPHMEIMRAAVNGGYHVCLLGPAGTGKTYSSRELAREHDCRLITVQASADLAVEDLRGTIQLVDGNTKFVPGPVTYAVSQPQTWLLVEEINLARPGCTAFLNTVLDPNGKICIPETGQEIAVHPDFRAIFCLNDISSYAGTQPMNAALRDRMVCIECDYLPPDIEIDILRSSFPEIFHSEANQMVTVANNIRASRKGGEHDFDFSIRSLEQWWCDAYNRTCCLMESFKAIVLPKVGSALEYGPIHDAFVEIAALELKEGD